MSELGQAVATDTLRLERLLPIDQFPWSAHLELVAVFRR